MTLLTLKSDIIKNDITSYLKSIDNIIEQVKAKSETYATELKDTFNSLYNHYTARNYDVLKDFYCIEDEVFNKLQTVFIGRNFHNDLDKYELLIGQNKVLFFNANTSEDDLCNNLTNEIIETLDITNTPEHFNYINTLCYSITTIATFRFIIGEFYFNR